MAHHIRPTSSYLHPTKRRTDFSVKKINRKPWKYAGIVLGALLVIGAIVDFAFVSNERYMMRKIEVVRLSSTPYVQLPDQDIVAQLEGAHYYLTKYRGVLRRIAAVQPLVTKLDLEPSAAAGIYELTITYAPVQMMIRFGGKGYGLLSGELYPLQVGTSGMMLQIPTYFTGMTLSGLFYDVPADQLAKQYHIIVNGLSDKNIQSMTYHPASHQIQVNTLQQEIYFDVTGNIFEQLKKYRTLLKNQQTVVEQRLVDLGSVEDGVFTYP